MKIEQIYTGCLSQGAYYIVSENEAVVIDPLRDVLPYVERAKKDGAIIKYIFETHFHADFVSGHLDLQQQTGATIVYGPGAKPGFNAHIAQDGEVFKLGKISFTVLHTPGHSPESICFLLKDERGKDTALFTGDTLFIGDVGRPDLAQKRSNLSQQELAGMLYESVHSKILPLANDIRVYPGHGAGSACGKNLSKETTDLLGNQKQVNYALQPMTKEDFVGQITEGQPKPPAYFPLNVQMNMQGYESIETLTKKGLHAFSPKEVEEKTVNGNAIVLDVRKAEDYAKAHIPGSINIGLDGSFAPWAGALINVLNKPIIFVSDVGRESEVLERLARVGIDYTLGYLKNGIAAWQEENQPINQIRSVDATDLDTGINMRQDTILLDVRKPVEYSAGHLANAINSPLDDMPEAMHDLDKQTDYYIYCAGGYRSMIFASLLKANGFANVVNIKGGYAAICESNKFALIS